MDAKGAGQLRPGKAAEVNRAECADVAAEERGFVGAIDAIGANLPAPGVPGAEFIGHLDDHGTRCAIGPRRQCRLDVEQAYPHAIPKTETEPTRLRQEKKQRMIQRQERGSDPRHPVDIQ